MGKSFKAVCKICDTAITDYVGEIAGLNVLDDSGGYKVSVKVCVCPACRITFTAVDGNNKPRTATVDKKLSRLPTPSTNPKGGRKKLLENQLKIFDSINAIDENSLLVDLGCGPGDFIWLAHKRCEAVGIDINQRNVKACQTAGLQACCSDINSYRPRHKFSHAALRHVLEHVTDPVKTLSHVRRHILKPGGVIGIEVPHGRFPVIDSIYPYYHMTHKWYFVPQTLEYVLKKAGFGKVKFKKVDPPHNSGAFYTLLQAAGLNPPHTGRVKIEPRFPSLNYSPEKVVVDFFSKWKNYLARFDKRLRKKLERCSAERKTIAVWGAGAHTCELLKNTCLKNYPVKYLIDKSPGRIGRSLYGMKILSPREILPDKADLVVISARAFERQIAEELNAEFPQLDYIKLYS